MKRATFLCLFLILFVLLNAVGFEILFSNDVLGSISPTMATWMNKEFPPPVGNGLSALVMIQEERENALKNDEKVLLLDAGSLMRHRPITRDLNMDSVIWYFNKAKYDVINIGVYDTYYGPDIFKKLFSSINAQIISSNLHAPGEGKLYKRYVIRNIDGVKVGIFGLVPASLRLYIPEEWYPYFSADDETLTARAMVKELRDKGCTVIVMLSSCGYARDYRIAESVPGIDIILGGFDGKGMREPIETPNNHTLIFRTYGRLGSIGRLHLKTGVTGNIKYYKGDMPTLFEERYPIYK